MQLSQTLAQQPLLTVYKHQSPLDYADLLWALKATGKIEPKLKDIVEVKDGTVYVSDRARMHGFKLNTANIPEGFYTAKVIRKNKEVELFARTEVPVSLSKFEARHRNHTSQSRVEASSPVVGAKIALATEGILINHQFAVDAFDLKKTDESSRICTVHYNEDIFSPVRIVDDIHNRFAIISQIVSS